MIENLRLGCLHFGNLIKADEVKDIVNYALKLGVNKFDISPLYGSGRAISVLGEALKGHDEEICISMSIGLKARSSVYGFGVETEKFRAGYAKQKLEELRDIAKRDFNFIVNVHALHLEQSSRELFGELEELTYTYPRLKLSASNISPADFEGLRIEASDFGVCLETLQLQANPLEQRLIREAKRYVGLKLNVNRPFGRGLLIQNYSASGFRPEGSRASISERLNDYLKGPVSEALFSVRNFLVQREIDPVLFCLCWLLFQPGVVGVTFGVRTIEQIRFLSKVDLKTLSKLKEIVKEFDTWLLTRPDLGRVVYALPKFTFER